jgi:hypothetical protein
MLLKLTDACRQGMQWDVERTRDRSTLAFLFRPHIEKDDIMTGL